MKYLSILLSLFISNSVLAAPKAFERLRETTLRFDIGSGSLVLGRSGKSYMLTNQHVCESSEVQGYMHGGLPDGTSFVGHISKENSSVDLCAIRVNTLEYHPLKLGKEFPYAEELYTRGYPGMVLGEFTGRYVGSTTWINMSDPTHSGCPEGSKDLRSGNLGLYGCESTIFNYLTTLYAKGGSSGSPVVDSNGDLVGVVQSTHPTLVGQTKTGIVPYPLLKQFLKDL